MRYTEVVAAVAAVTMAGTGTPGIDTDPVDWLPREAAAPPSQEEIELVTLKNGLTYRVRTRDGMPVPFKSELIEVKALGLTLNTATNQLEWVLTALVKAKGRFHVAVATPVNGRLSTTFECDGPGEVVRSFFGSTDYPPLWNWIEEDGVTWIPLVFTFRSQGLGQTFQAVQWQKFNPGAKATLARVLKRPR